MLKPGNWNPDIYENLKNLIENHHSKNELVLFDFDNTIVLNDLGDYVFEYLVNANYINEETVQVFSPPFLLEGETVSIQKDGLWQYYKKLHKLNDDKTDAHAPINAYAWAAQVMVGATVSQVAKATRECFEKDFLHFFSLKPEIFPEMLDLIAQLHLKGFCVGIISASNVWSLRWFVHNILNRALREKYGEKACFRLDSVIGINLLLSDKQEFSLYKDEYLWSNLAYLQMDENELDDLAITSMFNFPITSYHGKLAQVRKRFGDKKVLLACGDSFNDSEMFSVAEHCLYLKHKDRGEENGEFLTQINTSVTNTWIQEVDKQFVK